MKILTILWCPVLLFSLFATAYCQNPKVLSGKGVYFFGPSGAEADSMNQGNIEAIDDFGYYTTQIGPFLKAKHLQSGYVSDRNIEVHYGLQKHLSVTRDSVDFGTILTDGTKMPLVLQYVLTDEELKEEISKYFKLK